MTEEDWGSLVFDGHTIKLTKDQYNKIDEALTKIDPLYKVKYGSVTFNNLPEHIIEQFRGT